jgi:hypothetical protein
MTMMIHLLVVVGEDDASFVGCATRLHDFLLVHLPANTGYGTQETSIIMRSCWQGQCAANIVVHGACWLLAMRPAKEHQEGARDS